MREAPATIRSSEHKQENATMTQGSEPPKPARRTRGAEIMLQTLPVGTRLILRDGTQVEIVENPQDGQWLFVRPAGSDQDPELVFAADVAELPEQ
jgi:hypothetical protein